MSIFQHQGPQPGTVSCVAMAAEMPREVKVKTLEGGDLMVEVMQTTTIERSWRQCFLKRSIVKISRSAKSLQVNVLVDGLLIDGDQTLESAGLLHAESEVTVIYSRNDSWSGNTRSNPGNPYKRASSKSTSRLLSQKFLPEAFKKCNQVVRGGNPRVCDGHWELCLCILLQVLGKYHYPGVCDGHWGSVRSLHIASSLASITIPESVTTIGNPCLSMLLFSEERQLSLVLWQPLGIMHLQLAILWRASLSPSPWRPLGSVPLKLGAVLWQASQSLRLWRPLRTLPLTVASPWQASLSLSPWWPLGSVPFISASLCKASLFLSLCGRMGRMSLMVSCKG